MSFIGYIYDTEETVKCEAQRKEIIDFAKVHNLDLSTVYSDISFDKLKNAIAGNCAGIIVYNITCLGTTLSDISDILFYCKNNNLSLYSVCDDYHFTLETLTDEVLYGLSLAIDIRSKLISLATRKALANKKAQGFKLGRAGKFNRKHVLTGKEAEVHKLLDSGMPKLHIAKHFNITPSTLYNFLKREKIIQTNKENYYA